MYNTGHDTKLPTSSQDNYQSEHYVTSVAFMQPGLTSHETNKPENSFWQKILAKSNINIKILTLPSTSTDLGTMCQFKAVEVRPGISKVWIYLHRTKEPLSCLHDLTLDPQ